MNKVIFNRQGVSFFDLLIAVCIAGILFAGGQKVFTAITKSYIHNNDSAKIQQEAANAMDELNRFLRQAPANTVVISAAAVPANSQIDFNSNSGRTAKKISYFLSQGSLYRSVNGVANKVADDFTTVFFAKRSSRLLQGKKTTAVFTFFWF